MRYGYSPGLPVLLERLELSVLISTYQAGREIAPHIQPEGEHDIAFLARSCHHTGLLMGHDLAWCGDRLWLVSTLFNGLVTIEGDWSFVPRWQPPFISGWAAGDRCHLNGLAIAEDGSAPAYVTALGETDTENGWREHKATGGCLVHVPSGEVVLRGLSMPHSPRLYQGQLYLLDSGRGAFLVADWLTAEKEHNRSGARLYAWAGLLCWSCLCGFVIDLATALFGGLPLNDNQQELLWMLAIVDRAGRVMGARLWIPSGLADLSAVCLFPVGDYHGLSSPQACAECVHLTWMGRRVATG